MYTGHTKRRIWAIWLGLVHLACLISSISGAEWLTKYEQAEQTAREQGKSLLVYFSASDWNEECKLLKKSVFDTPEFGRFAADKLILLELDFPNDKPQPPEVTEANAAVARRFGVRAFPTILLINPAGAQKRYGYMEGGPEVFVKALTEGMTAQPEKLPTSAAPAVSKTNQTEVIKAPVTKGTLGWAIVDPQYAQTPAAPAPAPASGGTLTPRPGLVMVNGPNGQVSFYGPSAGSRTAEIPAEALAPAMTNLTAPKPVYRQLVLKGITGSAKRPLALINSRTFSPGESARLTVDGQMVKVTCQSIALDHVMILVDEEPEPRKLSLEP